MAGSVGRFSSLNPKFPYHLAMLRPDLLSRCLQVHIAGLGDYYIRSVTHLPDPCPLPGSLDPRGDPDLTRHRCRHYQEAQAR